MRKPKDKTVRDDWDDDDDDEEVDSETVWQKEFVLAY